MKKANKICHMTTTVSNYEIETVKNMLNHIKQCIKNVIFLLRANFK